MVSVFITLFIVESVFSNKFIVKTNAIKTFLNILNGCLTWKKRLNILKFTFHYLIYILG